MPKEAYYFSHDCNARTDPKIMAMLLEYKGLGYGLFWTSVEMLSEQSGYKLKLNKITFNAIAMAMLCESNAVENFINSCISDYELFQSDGIFFWSESLIRRLTIKEEKRQKRSEAGKKGAESRWKNSYESENLKQNNNNAIANSYQADSIAIAKHGKGKESKVKESKVNNINIPYQDIFDLYVKQGIVKHKTLTEKMRASIKKANSKYTIEQLKIAIERYGLIYRDNENEYAKNFGKYQWTLEELMSREKGISEFLDEGGKWIRYTESKNNFNKSKENISNGSSKQNNGGIKDKWSDYKPEVPNTTGDVDETGFI